MHILNLSKLHYSLLWQWLLALVVELVDFSYHIRQFYSLTRNFNSILIFEKFGSGFFWDLDILGIYSSMIDVIILMEFIQDVCKMGITSMFRDD